MTLTTEQRRAIWERDGGICGICSKPVPWEYTDIDHIMPQHARGSHHPANLRAAHVACNRRRPRKSLADVPAAVRALPLDDAVEGRLLMKLDPKTLGRLRALEQRLELSRPAVVRMAVRKMAERHGLEDQRHTPAPPAPGGGPSC